MLDRIKSYIRKIILEATIDADGNLVGFDNTLGPDEILFDYAEARKFAEEMKQHIPGLQKYELADYFPSSGYKESYTYEQRLMSNEIFNVFIDHEVRDERSFWRLRFGSPANPSVVGDPTVTDISYDSKDIEGFDAFVKKANRDKDAWDFDAW
ncbi:MAG: hypothetical protein P8J32_00275 [bacterium]|nr:hypothetical protein [bacterium]